jgi:hypothetical protein
MLASAAARGAIAAGRSRAAPRSRARGSRDGGATTAVDGSGLAPPVKVEALGLASAPLALCVAPPSATGPRQEQEGRFWVVARLLDDPPGVEPLFADRVA